MLFYTSTIYNTVLRTFSSKIRVRFAPSPTGFLHLGGLRTALYNFLFAKSRNGKFILRIEDTDQSRLVKGAIEAIQTDLEWAGIEIDEGPHNNGSYGPYIQSHRLDIYKKNVETLLNNGSAYRCFCSDKRLDLLRKQALKTREIPKYDNKCRDLAPSEVEKRLADNSPFCIRFKLKPDIQSFSDLIYGEISYEMNEGDPVIIKTDGFPTYHFANVVDDYHMKITHVLRGVEWQISTIKHLLLYKAFNWPAPQFGHLPLLLNSDGTKLSKRQGDITISHYRNTEIFPLALINFIVNSGGGFNKDVERHLKPKSYTIEQLSSQFDIGKINAHSGKLMNDRLLEFNRLELKRQFYSGDCNLIRQVQDLIRKDVKDLPEISENHIRNVLDLCINRIDKLSDLVSTNLKFIWNLPKTCDISQENQEKIQLLIREFSNSADLKKDVLSVFLKEFCSKNNVNYGAFMRTLRLILSGLKEGPSVAEIVDILGKENTIERLWLSIKNK